MAGVDRDRRAVVRRMDDPAARGGVEPQRAQRMAHQHAVAALDDAVARRLPHHARSLAGIAEAFQQRLGRHAVVGRPVEPQRSPEPVEHRPAQAQPLDALRRPVRGHRVARHPPHLLGIGLEEDRIQLVAELVDHPVLEAPDVPARRDLRLEVACHAQRRRPRPQVEQRLERAQRIAVEPAAIEDAAHARALDEIVGQDLVPQIDHLPRLREEPVPADVEAEAVMLHGAADPAHVHRILLDHRDAVAEPGELIGGGKAGRPRADDRDVDGLAGHGRGSGGWLHACRSGGEGLSRG